MFELHEELARCCPSQAETDALVSIGVTGKAIAEAGGGGVACVTIGTNDFEFPNSL